MYTVSDEYKAKIIAPARFMDYNGTITLSDGTTKTINCDNLEAGSLYYDVKAVSGSEFALGGCYAAELGFGLLYDSSNQYSLYGAKVEISIRLEIDENQFESVPLGVFSVDEIQREKNVVYVKALDRMLMFDKAYPTDKISAKLPLTLISEACSACGVELSNTSLSGFANSSVKLSADENQVGTYRELIGMVCEVIGAFAVINRYGKLEIKKFSGTAVAEYEDFFSSAPKLSDFAVSVGKIVYKNTVSGTSGRSLVMQANPFFESMSTSQLSSSLGAILNQLSGVTFYGCEASTFGDPALDAGDIITVRGKPVMIMGYTYNFRGISSIESYGDQYEGDVEYDATKRLAQTVANNLNYLKVNYLDAYSITSTYATIANLNATNISVESLRATAATIENLKAVSGRVETLEANSITAAYVEANYAKINLANIANGAIKNIMIDVGAVGEAQIADGSITDAKIVELTANKITAGTLSVERLEIRGTDKSIVYALNNITGALQPQPQKFDTLNGEILTQRTITADKIVANAITSKEIAAKTITANEIATNTITADKLIVTTLSSITADLGTVTAGTIKSKNYVSGTSGMKLLLDTGEWDSKNFKISSDGSITATSGAIDGFTIGATYIANNTTALAGAANSVYLGTNGISCGKTFKVTKTGALTATSGTIGGFTIGATTLKSSGGGYTSVLACYDNDSPTSRVMHCYAGDDPNNDTFRILRDGTVISGGSNNQVRMKEGHLDFYYGDAYSGRLGQSADNKITIEGTHLQLDAGKHLYGNGLQLIGATTSGNIAIGSPSQSGAVYLYSGQGDIKLVSGKNYRIIIYCTDDSGNVQLANFGRGGLALVNGKAILGITTSNKSVNLVQMSTTNHLVIGSASQPGNTHICCSSSTYTKFYVGNDNIASMTVNGLQFKNETGILLNSKIALRYYDSKVYCGADTEPLVLIGSSISFSGTIAALTATSATINGSLTAAGATINGTATVNGLTVNGGVTAYSLTTTYGVSCASLTTSGNVALDNDKYVSAKDTSGTAYSILGINSEGHAAFGSSSLAGNAYVMCKDGYYVNLRVGSVNVAAISSSGLLMPNDMMIMCGTASSHVNAIRLKTTEIGVGYASIPLKLVGSAVTTNGSAVTSDRRLKTDINPLGDKYAELIDKLPAVNYRYTTHRQNVVNCGFIAQDVLAALSEVGLTADEFGGFVDVYGDGREFALDYTQFVPILWEQIKTLKAKIKTLEEVNL